MADSAAAWDASPVSGFGFVDQNETYALPIPAWLEGRAPHMVEAINVVGGVTYLSNYRKLSDCRLLIYCDNEPTVIAFNTGKAKCPVLLACLKQLFVVCSLNNILVSTVHWSSETMRLADSASRIHHPNPAKRKAAVKIFESEVLPGSVDVTARVAELAQVLFNPDEWFKFKHN